MIADHFFPVPRVQLDADGVAHGAGGQKQRRLLAKHLRDALFQSSDGGILAVNVVADLGLGHGAPHGGSRFGYGIAAQIDHTNSANTSFESRTPRGGQPQRCLIGLKQSIPNEAFDRGLERRPVALQMPFASRRPRKKCSAVGSAGVRSGFDPRR